MYIGILLAHPILHISRIRVNVAQQELFYPEEGRSNFLCNIGSVCQTTVGSG
jgi:hypothetical protein